MTDHKPLSEGEMEPWVMVKRGLFYRADYHGYTSDIAQAGRYSRKLAEETAAIEPERIKAFPLSHFREQTQRAFDEAKAVLELFATPKPLDGEAVDEKALRQILAEEIKERGGPQEYLDMLANKWMEIDSELPSELSAALAAMKRVAALSLPAPTCEATDQFNAGRNDGLEAAVQLLIDYGNPGNDATWAAIRALKRPTP